MINNIDRDGVDPHKVLDKVFDLFVSLHATDEQLDFPTVLSKEPPNQLIPRYTEVGRHVSEDS